MGLNEKELDRVTEMVYTKIYQQLKENIPSDKFFIYMENFCRVFDIDYTAIMIVSTKFMRRIQPTIFEEVIFAIKTDSTLVKLGYDYRTIRKYRKKMEDKYTELYPRISNRFVHQDLRKFINAYSGLHMSESYWYEFYEEGGFRQ